MSHSNLPDKPNKQKDQISDLWDAVFNHLPTQISWLNVKMNFTLVIMGIILALIAASIILAM